jgi:hypothetical protein
MTVVAGFGGPILSELANDPPQSKFGQSLIASRIFMKPPLKSYPADVTTHFPLSINVSNIHLFLNLLKCGVQEGIEEKCFMFPIGKGDWENS